MNRTNLRNDAVNGRVRSPGAPKRVDGPATRPYQNRWFRFRRRRHDPWLVLNMSMFNCEAGRTEIFNPIRSHQNIWC